MTARTAIHVVAGLLIDGGKVCITRRRPDAHQGGKWEFPGGKLDPDEPPLAGLRRELHEEIGIDVTEAQPFLQIRHVYPEREVLLDVWSVGGYRGTPHGREGQELRWGEIDRLTPQELPEADRPVLRRLQLPPLYVISDARRFGLAPFAARLERALRAGARLVQLREPHLPRAEFCAYAREIAVLCRRFGARLLVNADIEWLPDCDAEGVHLSSRRLMTLSSRPLGAGHWIGASCHDAVEIERARAIQTDLVVLGPVHATASHPGMPVLGWSRFAALTAGIALPIYALGGMRPEDLPAARAAGAHGLGMISGIWGRDDLEAVVRAVAPCPQAVPARER
jgi:8-oxo-dGTP diphosphatase